MRNRYCEYGEQVGSCDIVKCHVLEFEERHRHGMVKLIRFTCRKFKDGRLVRIADVSKGHVQEVQGRRLGSGPRSAAGREGAGWEDGRVLPLRQLRGAWGLLSGFHPSYCERHPPPRALHCHPPGLLFPRAGACAL